MDKIAIVGCGAYMDDGYGCPGEWRCLKAASLGEGKMQRLFSVCESLPHLGYRSVAKQCCHQSPCVQRMQRLYPCLPNGGAFL